MKDFDKLTYKQQDYLEVEAKERHYEKKHKKVYLDDLSKNEQASEAYRLFTANKQLVKNNNALTTLSCKSCKHSFKVESNYSGIVTCPYCSDYVDG